MKFNLTDQQKKWLKWGAVALLVAVLGFFGFEGLVNVPPTPTASPVPAATGIYPANSIYFLPGGKTEVFQSGATLHMEAGSTAVLSGTNYIKFPVYTWATLVPTTTGDYVITPTATYMLLSPVADVETTMAACVSGQYTVLYDAVDFAIVLTDTGNLIAAGNQTLGQYDTLPLACISGKWVQIGPVSAN